jgi:hypothetical protein
LAECPILTLKHASGPSRRSASPWRRFGQRDFVNMFFIEFPPHFIIVVQNQKVVSF